MSEPVVPDPSPAELAAARVVIVDDEPMVTETLRTFLDLELDIAPTTFNDPALALAHIREHEVDLVISDLLMPKMDGIRFLVEVRREQPGVPRVLLTGYADKQNAINAINEVRLFQYIQKPWDNEHLRAVVIKALKHLFLMRRLATTFDAAAADRNDLHGLRDLLLAALA